MPPPYAQIDPPTPYADWVQTKELFPDGAKDTHTRSYDHKTLADKRIVFGFIAKNEFWFFVIMTQAEEQEFWGIYRDWRARQTGAHEFAAYSRKPPACGTPNTPICPPPGDEIGDALDFLAELAAGPGATKAEILVKREKAHDMVMKTIDGATTLLQK